MAGTCSAAILPPYGLVLITPQGDTLTWRSQEPSPYTFTKVQLNMYGYNGPTALGDGAVSMTLTFTGPTALVMTRTYSPNAEPGCTHTHNYTGTFQWNSN